MAYTPVFTQPTRKPTLTPDFDTPSVVVGVPGAGKSVMDAIDPSDAIAAANSTSAVGAITITAAGANGDKVTATVRGVAFAATNGGADTPTTLAAALAAAINAHSVLGVLVRASNAAGVLTVRAIYPGQVANGFSFSVAVTGTATASVTTAWGNGTGELITPLENFTIQVGKNTLSLRANRSFKGNAAIRTALANSGYLVS